MNNDLTMEIKDDFLYILKQKQIIEKVQIIKRTYNKYVLECEGTITEILNTKGKILVKAPTGGGKTYAILKVFKKLSKVNPNKVYVIACPNRSQNEQNEKLYSVYAVIGGKAIEEGVSVASMVYDKAKEMKEYIVKNKRELILVVDEAHQIIDSCIFREKALQHLKELESISTTTIHLTATPEKLLHSYVYDNIYVFKPNINKTNIKEHSLIILNNKDIIAQFIQHIKEIKSENNKTPIVFINNLGLIKECYKEFKKNNFKVGVIANKEKIKEKFNSILYPGLLKDRDTILKGIREKAKIDTSFDIVFATDIVACGVSFLNTDMILINTMLSPFDIDGDNINQRTSRPREKIDTAFTIIRDVEEQKPVKDKELIFNAVRNTVKRHQRTYQKTFDFLKNNFDFKTAVNHMNSILKFNTNKYLYYGALEIEEDKIIINKTTLIKAQFREYYKQFYFNHQELNELLRQRIKADKFKIIKKDYKINESEEERLKEIRKEIKTEKEEVKDQAIKMLTILKRSETGLNYLREYIKDTDILKDLPKELRKIIKILREEKTLLKLIKEFTSENIYIDKAVDIILNSKTRQEAKDYIKKHNYVSRNKMNDPLKANDEYTVYRKVFDSVIRKRITRKKIIELIKNNIICKIRKGKEKEFYITLLNELEVNKDKYDELKSIFELLVEGKNIPKEKGVSKAHLTKLLKPLVIIYNLSKDRKGYKITSLKTDVNS